MTSRRSWAGAAAAFAHGFMATARLLLSVVCMKFTVDPRP
jgi:hypothetical protein